jgi:hypothetical protein
MTSTEFADIVQNLIAEARRDQRRLSELTPDDADIAALSVSADRLSFLEALAEAAASLPSQSQASWQQFSDLIVRALKLPS